STPLRSDSTRYITSVESSPSTHVFTTTKVRVTGLDDWTWSHRFSQVYYTRDSPLTITSEYTSTVAPRTIVTTIIGSTTYTSELKPSKASVAPQSSVSLVNTVPKVEPVRPARPTRKPGVSRFKPPSRPTEPP